MTLVYPETGAAESSGIDLSYLLQKARILVANVKRHMHMSLDERRNCHEDLMQEALTQLFALLYKDGHPEAYAYVAARTNLIGYVFVNLRGGGSGHQWQLSKQYHTVDNLVEADERGEEPDARGMRVPLKLYQQRPTEEALLLRESNADTAPMWRQYERSLVRILAMMRQRQWHPDALCQAAQALCESARGTSNYNISRLLNLEWHATSSLLCHYRPYLEQFLQLSPLMQGLLLAEGELRLCWWEEVTSAHLNRGEKLIVIFPEGAFTVSYYTSKSKQKRLGRLQGGRRVNGKVCNRSVQLGVVGKITRDKLAAGVQLLQEKLSALTQTVNEPVEVIA